MGGSWARFFVFSGDSKKRAGESNKGIFENFFKNFRHTYLEKEKKRLEVARFKQCVQLGRQN